MLTLCSEVRHALESTKSGRQNIAHTLQRRIEHVKACLLGQPVPTSCLNWPLFSLQKEVAKLDEEHRRQRRESLELEAQIKGIEEESTRSTFPQQSCPLLTSPRAVVQLKKEKKLMERQSSKGRNGGDPSSAACLFLAKLLIIFLLVWAALEVLLWRTQRSEFLPELYHAYLSGLVPR